MRTVIEGGGNPANPDTPGGGIGGGGFSGGGMGGGFSINSPRLEVKNHGLSTAAYALLEYGGQSRLGAELGLRLDHFYFIADDFTLQTMPVFNPRLNVDFNVLNNKGIVNSLSLTAGTGLFSSMNDAVTSTDTSSNLKDFDLRPNRSWTSLLGSKIDFSGGFSFSIDGYYKYVFDRAYTVTTTMGQDTPLAAADDVTTVDYRFNGSGKIIGFDFQLQKMESRYWDGWLSYSFAWAQYLDPNAVPEPVPAGADRSDYPATGNDWHYPYFHRFHNINLVLNLKPSPSFTIGLRLGFASGTPDDADNSKRGGFSWPVDIKFSWHRFDPKGKVSTEIYLGIENLQSLAGISSWNAASSEYTGEEDMSEYKPVYDIPIPMVSFGFKWRY
jgi:hypothetical protein